MATGAETTVVYLAGTVQGIALVTFPAASTIFTERSGYDLSSTHYGAFGVAGLGCSALLPLTISFGQEELVAISASVAGGVIASYQLGYGIAAFGAGPLQDAGWGLPDIYRISAVIAVLMGGLSFFVTSRVRAPGVVAQQSVDRPA